LACTAHHLAVESSASPFPPKRSRMGTSLTRRHLRPRKAEPIGSIASLTVQIFACGARKFGCQTVLDALEGSPRHRRPRSLRKASAGATRMSCGSSPPTVRRIASSFSSICKGLEMPKASERTYCPALRQDPDSFGLSLALRCAGPKVSDMSIGRQSTHPCNSRLRPTRYSGRSRQSKAGATAQ